MQVPRRVGFKQSAKLCEPGKRIKRPNKTTKNVKKPKQKIISLKESEKFSQSLGKDRIVFEKILEILSKNSLVAKEDLIAITCSQLKRNQNIIITNGRARSIFENAVKFGAIKIN